MENSIQPCHPKKTSRRSDFFQDFENNHSFPLTLNKKTEVRTCQYQKHLGLIPDQWLNFTEHINIKISKFDKFIGIIKILFIIFTRNALLRIYKLFVRQYLDHANIICDKPKNASFQSKIENVKYRAYITIFGAIQGTSWEHLYCELRLESLKLDPKTCLFYKIVNGLSYQLT